MITVAADYADRRRWQQEGMIALIDLLAHAANEGPPPIPWTVLTIGALLGRADTPSQVTAWADFLAIQVTRIPTCEGIVTHRCDAHWRAVPVTVICD
jgi:hypothetical protein